MSIRPKWLNDICSILFSIYYIIYANEADEKVKHIAMYNMHPAPHNIFSFGDSEPCPQWRCSVRPGRKPPILMYVHIHLSLIPALNFRPVDPLCNPSQTSQDLHPSQDPPSSAQIFHLPETHHRILILLPC